MNKASLNSDIYDDLIVSDVSTIEKLNELAQNNWYLKNDARPRVYIIKNKIMEDIKAYNVFNVKEKDCPICESQYARRTILAKPENKFIAECNECGSYISFFTQTPLQRLISLVNSGIVNIITGYGSGKTTVDLYDVYVKAMTIDGADLMIVGASQAGIDQAKGEFSKFVANDRKDEKGVKGDLKIRNSDIWVFKNGSIIRWMTATGEVEKFRSYNLNHVLFIEASADAFYEKRGDSNSSVYDEVTARLRNSMGYITAYDSDGKPVYHLTDKGTSGQYSKASLNKLVLESNPENSKIIENVFNKSHILIMTENVANKEETIRKFVENYDRESIDRNVVTILASTLDNPTLPPDYFKSQFNGKPASYIARMRDCDMTRNENQVYPDSIFRKVKPVSEQTIKSADKIYQVFDPGGTDPAGILYAAMWKDWEKSGKPRLLLFDAKKTIGGPNMEGNAVNDIVNRFVLTERRWGLAKINSNGTFSQGYIGRDGRTKYITRIADTALKKRASKDFVEQDFDSQHDKFRKAGFNFKQAIKNKGTIAYGIELVNLYIENGILDWVETEEDLENEFQKFWYTTAKDGTLVPKVGNDHLMDTLRYLIFEVDYELNYSGNIFEKERANDKVANSIRTSITRRDGRGFEVDSDDLVRDNLEQKVSNMNVKSGIYNEDEYVETFGYLNNSSRSNIKNLNMKRNNVTFKKRR